MGLSRDHFPTGDFTVWVNFLRESGAFISRDDHSLKIADTAQEDV